MMATVGMESMGSVAEVREEDAGTAGRFNTRATAAKKGR